MRPRHQQVDRSFERRRGNSRAYGWDRGCGWGWSNKRSGGPSGAANRCARTGEIDKADSRQHEGVRLTSVYLHPFYVGLPSVDIQSWDDAEIVGAVDEDGENQGE